MYASRSVTVRSCCICTSKTGNSRRSGRLQTMFGLESLAADIKAGENLKIKALDNWTISIEIPSISLLCKACNPQSLVNPSCNTLACQLANKNKTNRA